MAMLLLSKGASLDALNKQNMSPYDIAESGYGEGKDASFFEIRKFLAEWWFCFRREMRMGKLYICQKIWDRFQNNEVLLGVYYSFEHVLGSLGTTSKQRKPPITVKGGRVESKTRAKPLVMAGKRNSKYSFAAFYWASYIFAPVLHGNITPQNTNGALRQFITNGNYVKYAACTGSTESTLPSECAQLLDQLTRKFPPQTIILPITNSSGLTRYTSSPWPLRRHQWLAADIGAGVVGAKNGSWSWECDVAPSIPAVCICTRYIVH